MLSFGFLNEIYHLIYIIDCISLSIYWWYLHFRELFSAFGGRINFHVCFLQILNVFIRNCPAKILRVTISIIRDPGGIYPFKTGHNQSSITTHSLPHCEGNRMLIRPINSPQTHVSFTLTPELVEWSLF